MKILAILVLSLVFIPFANAACSTDSDCRATEFCDFKGCGENEGICAPKPVSCTNPGFEDIGEVCGCNGVTYKNDCERQSLGVSENYHGACIAGISSENCAQAACQQDLQCTSFPGIGKRCAQPNACSYFDCPGNTVCSVKKFAPGVPNEVVCSGDCATNWDCEPDEFCDRDLNQPAGMCKTTPSSCGDEASPVCGGDGITYSNDCYRQQAGTALNYKGSCIAEISNVTCGAADFGEGTCDFTGSCVSFPGIGSRCASTDGFDYWPCPSGFTLESFPTFPWRVACMKTSCASDADCGSTPYTQYGCLLRENCTGPISSTGYCGTAAGACIMKDDTCLQIDRPVCGVNGITYRNNCQIMNAGVIKKYDGECKQGGMTDITCTSSASCPGSNMECYSFPGVGLKCATKDPCSYFECPENTKCELSASYPPRVICSGTCTGPDCNNLVTRNGTASVVIGRASYNISLNNGMPTAGGGFSGVIGFGNVYVSSTNVEVQGSSLVMKTSAGPRQINVPPQNAVMVSQLTGEIKNIELREEDQKPVYAIRSSTRVKLFGLIPVFINADAVVSAENGSVISKSKPWWSFLGI